MTDATPPEPFSQQVVLTHAGTEAVTVRRDIPWSDGTDRVMDIYRPPDSEGRALAAVVLVTGFPDDGFQAMFGRRMKDTAPYVSWATLIAASGLAAVTYTNRDPRPDAAAVVASLTANANSLDIDTRRLGIWACSGNVPNALSLLPRRPAFSVRCASLLYGYMLDLDGSTAVADASRQFHFAVPPVTVGQIPEDLPIALARAGRDETPGLNDSLDAFRRHALAAGRPVQLLEHPTGAHAFDLSDDSDMSRSVVAGILRFLTEHLLADDAP